MKSYMWHDKHTSAKALLHYNCERVEFHHWISEHQGVATISPPPLQIIHIKNDELFSDSID